MDRDNRRVPASQAEHEVEARHVKIYASDRENPAGRCSPGLLKQPAGVILATRCSIGVWIDMLVRRNRHFDARARKVARKRRQFRPVIACDREQQKFGIFRPLRAMMKVTLLVNGQAVAFHGISRLTLRMAASGAKPIVAREAPP